MEGGGGERQKGGKIRPFCRVVGITRTVLDVDDLDGGHLPSLDNAGLCEEVRTEWLRWIHEGSHHIHAHMQGGLGFKVLFQRRPQRCCTRHRPATSTAHTLTSSREKCMKSIINQEGARQRSMRLHEKKKKNQKNGSLDIAQVSTTKARETAHLLHCAIAPTTNLADELKELLRITAGDVRRGPLGRCRRHVLDRPVCYPA